MAVTKLSPYSECRGVYMEYLWEDNESYFRGWTADSIRFVPAHEIEDGDYDANEPDWYKEVYGEV